MAVAKIDIETIRCIYGSSLWDFCIKLKGLRGEVAKIELEVERLLESLL
ncbi:MAG: hypothetical protein ACK4SY_03150 [Pyrobaculum sp.]